MLFKDLEDGLITRLRLHPRFDNRNEFALVLPSRGIGRKAGVFNQLRPAHSLTHIGPLSVQDEDDYPALGSFEHPARTHQGVM